MKYLIVILLFMPLMARASVLGDINQVRVSHGLSPLSYNYRLSVAAASHGMDFLSQNYFAHITPQGKDINYFINKAHYPYCEGRVGENLSANYSEKTVINAWMDSPEHKVNILNPKFTKTGIAIIYGQYNLYIVQIFSSC